MKNHLRQWIAQLVPQFVSDESRTPLWTLIYLGFLFMNWLDTPAKDRLLPTLLCSVVFLVLFFSALRRKGVVLLGHAVAMAALCFALTPVNTGANTLLIYAFAILPFAGVSIRMAMLVIVATLLLYFGELMWLGWPLRFVILSTAITGVIGAAITGANHHQRERRLRQAELKLSHDEVRRLAALAERERIGRDLHDLLGHTLSLITLKSELAVRLFDRDPVAARSEIVDVERVARDALGQVRRAVSGIRAAGLAAELASARLLLESSDVRLDYAVGDDPLPATIETVLALSVREAITNIQRHAQATQVTVRLGVVNGQARLSIEDNGNGRTITPGNGLTGMRERLRALDGELTIESVRGSGSVLRVGIPVPESLAAAPAAAVDDWTVSRAS